MSETRQILSRAARLKRLLPLLFGAACLFVLWRKGGDLDWQVVWGALSSISPAHWAMALLATAGSFWALAQYDLIAHRHFGTDTAPDRARAAGASAIALGQVIGMGPAVGAAVRWRLMPGLGHKRVVQLTAFVTLTFLAAWALLAATLALPMLGGFGWAGLVLLPLALILFCAVLLRYPRLNLGVAQVTLPSLPAALRLVALCLIDMVFAGLALYFLLPEGVVVPFLPLIAAYMLALGAGLMGGTPGGVGPFELCLATLLPQMAAADLAATLIAYRAVYYALPCLIGAGYALIAAPCPRGARASAPAPLQGPRAEHAIAAQADAEALRVAGAEACLLRNPQSLTLFLGPTHGPLPALLPALRRQALGQNRVACLYKIAGRDAVALRQTGWTVAPLAQEAVIDPQDFALQGSARRQLRRALRKAQSAGVETRHLHSPDWKTLAEVNAAWASRNGGERGLTMGRFCPDFLADKPIFAAYLDGQPIAFATGVEGGGALSLDLMRQRCDAPAGTMQMLVLTMIEHAKTKGYHEVCLAALPHPRLARFDRHSHGLTRFKKSFAPSWRPLYIAAPGWPALLIAACDIWLSIRFPAIPRGQHRHGASWDTVALQDSASPQTHSAQDTQAMLR
ncbi:MAG: GNAT family N-acetyltransferase [Pelagimonas sp.]|jgi:phosphatidylglycerol lysyltransferase|nr:GNAT family N-acetyltransferase [Pelagimonas sp.]